MGYDPNIFHLLVGEITHLLTIDTKFLGHPSIQQSLGREKCYLPYGGETSMVFGMFTLKIQLGNDSQIDDMQLGKSIWDIATGMSCWYLLNRL